MIIYFCVNKKCLYFQIIQGLKTKLAADLERELEELRKTHSEDKKAAIAERDKKHEKVLYFVIYFVSLFNKVNQPPKCL